MHLYAFYNVYEAFFSMQINMDEACEQKDLERSLCFKKLTSQQLSLWDSPTIWYIYRGVYTFFK